MDGREPTERERRGAMLLHWLCPAAMAYTFTAAAFYTWVRPIPWLVWLNLATGALVLVNELAFLKHRRLFAAQSAFAALGVVCLPPMFLTGGVSGAAFVWYFAYLIFAYVLLGPRYGTVWSVALVAVTAALLVAGVAPSPYPGVFLVEALWAYGLSMFLIYVLIRGFDESQRRVEQAAAERGELAKLRELDQLRTAMLSTVSHELKTPLTPMMLQTQILESERTGPLNDKQRKSVAILRRNTERLGALVEQTLDVARMQAKSMRLDRKEVALRALVQEAVESFEDAARARGVALVMGDLQTVSVSADAPRLTQVLYNLVSNAIKFTPSGGSVIVSINVAPHSARVAVKDSGQGLRPQDIAQLFKPFARVEDAVVAKKEGTGLGLYISKGIVEAHGGAMGVESEGLGKGSEFWFTLPRAATS